MNSGDDKPQGDFGLRAAAEGRLEKDLVEAISAGRSEPWSQIHSNELLHDLQVHQIELEMQNEALREAKLALEESRDRYVDLYEFAPVGYLTLGSDGFIAEINLTGSAFFGVERRNLLRRCFASYVIEADQGRWERHFHAVQRGDRPEPLALALRRGDGTLSFAQLDCVAACMPPDPRAPANTVRPAGESAYGSSALGVRIALTDISERRRIEEALRMNHLALKAISQGVIIARPDGCIVSVNDAFLSISGYGRTDVLGQNCVFFQGPLTDPRTVQSIHRALNQVGEFSGELLSYRKDGSTFWNELTISPVLDELGQLSNFISITRDISARKRAESELYASEAQLRRFSSHLQQVREADRAHFARELHDDLGQSLTALRIDFDQLAGALVAEGSVLPAIVARLAPIDQMILGTVDSVRRICEDLRPRMLDDLGLTAALASHVKRFSAQTGIACDLALEDYELGERQSTAIFRIVQESLTNVARHARASNVILALQAGAADELVLTIADDGCGMSAESQADGHRFGLLGMRERVTMLGGRMTIDSEPGRGTHIEVFIPLKAAMAMGGVGR